MISLPQFHKPAPAAGCGPARCAAMRIAVLELGKPAYARCAHLTSKCKIYESRPNQCRVFRCAWHLSFLGDRVDRRPDQTALVLSFEEQDGRLVPGDVRSGSGSGADGQGTIPGGHRAEAQARAASAVRPAALRIVPYGADLPFHETLWDIYESYVPPTGPPRDEN
jgi:hypothetical protein